MLLQIYYYPRGLRSPSPDWDCDQQDKEQRCPDLNVENSQVAEGDVIITDDNTNTTPMTILEGNGTVDPTVTDVPAASSEQVQEAINLNSEVDATIKVCALVGLNLNNHVGVVAEEIVSELNEVVDQ